MILKYVPCYNLVASTYIKGGFKEENPYSDSQRGNTALGISADAADTSWRGLLVERKCCG